MMRRKSYDPDSFSSHTSIFLLGIPLHSKPTKETLHKSGVDVLSGCTEPPRI